MKEAKQSDALYRGPFFATPVLDISLVHKAIRVDTKQKLSRPFEVLLKRGLSHSKFHTNLLKTTAPLIKIT